MESHEKGRLFILKIGYHRLVSLKPVKIDSFLNNSNMSSIVKAAIDAIHSNNETTL